jgi:hypothetical protein
MTKEQFLRSYRDSFLGSTFDKEWFDRCMNTKKAKLFKSNELYYNLWLWVIEDIERDDLYWLHASLSREEMLEFCRLSEIEVEE